MDARRLLIAAACGLLGSCALLRSDAPRAEPPLAPTEAASVETLFALEPVLPAADAIPTVGVPVTAPVTAPVAPVTAKAPPDAALRAAEPVVGDRQEGRIQVFAWTPGRVFEVRTAPLRVTTLTLSPGETVTAKAAGDTVRWQIGETTSGSGATARTHVMLKPLQRGLSTNLVLTTDRRVYLIDLESGPVERFHPAVAWEVAEAAVASEGPAADGLAVAAAETPVEGPADAPLETDVDTSTVEASPEPVSAARYRILASRRAVWAPTTVFDDGRRTFIVLPRDRRAPETPILRVHGPDGAQVVNYRQDGEVLIVDRLFDRAELRRGGRRPEVVTLVRMGGGRP